MTRFIGLIRERMKSDTEFSDSGKEWVPIWEEITLSKLDIGIGDGDNDGEGDEDDAGDDYNGVQMIDCTISCF